MRKKSTFEPCAVLKVCSLSREIKRPARFVVAASRHHWINSGRSRSSALQHTNTLPRQLPFRLFAAVPCVSMHFTSTSTITIRLCQEFSLGPIRPTSETSQRRARALVPVCLCKLARSACSSLSWSWRWFRRLEPWFLARLVLANQLSRYE